MPRARLLKPGFFKNPELSRLSTTHRLTYAGLWTLADREGRLEDSPDRIRAELFPYDGKVEIEPVLRDLAEHGFIRRYRVDRRRLIQIPKFLQHQNPHFKEPASELPPPRGHRDSGIVAFGVPAEQRQRILERDKFRCVRCGAGDNLTIDHLIARTAGGTNADSNLQVLCRRCNSKKSNRPEPPDGAPIYEPIYEASMDHAPRVGRAVAPTAGRADTVTVAVAESVSGKSSGAENAPPFAETAQKASDESPRNLGIITKLAHEAMGMVGETSSDLAETVKSLCALRKIDYDSTVVRKAIDSATVQRHRRQDA